MQRNKRQHGLFGDRLQYGCAAVNIKPIQPHKLPDGFKGDKRDICPSYTPMQATQGKQ